MMYKQIDSKIDFPKLEHEVMEFWNKTQVFEKLRLINEGKPKWSFIDGPITANNPMGVHHAWGRTYKDLWQRYKAMRGFDERYQNGFDCQGLWVEVEVEKDLGFKSKRDIEAYGIAEFVKLCKQRVLRYAAVQTEQSIRLGMWMDWDNPDELRALAEALDNPTSEITYQSPRGPVTDTAESIVGLLGSIDLGGSYFTLSNENNYAIWGALKSCHERGWIYKGEDSMPWCPRCSTGISQHEIVTEGYREIMHPSIYMKFHLRDREGSLLIWTTTPWTLTSNVAVAVHPDLVYVKVRFNGEEYYLSKGSLRSVFPGGGYEVMEELKGGEMEGWTYDGPYDELENPRMLGATENHRVILWDEVGETEGTGLVHVAPGAGKEDLELGRTYGLPSVAPLDEFGVFIKGFGWLTDTHVYDSTEPIFNDLRKKGLVFRTENYTHRYPVCWRCGSELVFRLVEEWFISMGEKLDKSLDRVTPKEREGNLRYQIMDSASQVRWIPDFGLKRELDWLQNMDDWMISKKRYWGLALPIWTCDCGWFDVIGSREELKERALEGWDKFEGRSPHRPYIDAIKIQCGRCGAPASRIPDVGNPWLDAGIVAYSTLQYRNDKAYWKDWFPADFITESFQGQFRNWFYSMLAMSTILERHTPFKVCLGHGTVLAEDGREMHKSWGNAIWFDDAAKTMGTDIMRWIYCATKPENDLLFGYTRAREVKRLFFMTLLNVHNFFAIYANLDKWSPDQKPHELSTLDRWILSKLNLLVSQATEALDNYDAYTTTQEIERFVDLLSRWYVRRSRRRFWKSETDDEKRAGYSTLYACLKILIQVMAPIVPHITEALYQKLVKPVEPDSPESLHLNNWPKKDPNLVDEKLMAEMDLSLEVSSLGRAARNKSGIKLRQPLQEAVIVANETSLNHLEKLSNLILDELNVKELRLTETRSTLEQYVIKPIPRLLGKKHGKMYPKIAEALKRLEQDKAEILASNESIKIVVEDESIEVLTEEVIVEFTPKENFSIMEQGDLLVGVNTVITEALLSEGLARDIVRRIQALRKEADFEIDDQIETYYQATSEMEDVFQKEAEYIKTETLSTVLHKEKPPEETYTGEYDIDNMKIRLGLQKVER